jgi:hypothetical protein
MSTAVHRRGNRPDWRGLASRAPKYDGLFVHRDDGGEVFPSSASGVAGNGHPRASDAGKRDLDTPESPP